MSLKGFSLLLISIKGLNAFQHIPRQTKPLNALHCMQRLVSLLVMFYVLVCSCILRMHHFCHIVILTVSMGEYKYPLLPPRERPRKTVPPPYPPRLDRVTRHTHFYHPCKKNPPAYSFHSKPQPCRSAARQCGAAFAEVTPPAQTRTESNPPYPNQPKMSKIPEQLPSLKMSCSEWTKT